MDKQTESKYEDESLNQSEALPDRRKLFRRLLGLAAGLGIAELVLEKERLLPSVDAVPSALDIDMVNTGTGTTELDSHPAGAAVFLAHNTSTADGSSGVSGVADAALGRGVIGTANATSGSNIGVLGQSNSTNGIGVFGSASATSGPALGVAGQSDSAGGVGVQGYASATTGACDGVYGQAASTSGVGVEGYVSATSGTNAGVFGRTDSTDGEGVGGLATASSGHNAGVAGQSNSTGGIGVHGYAAASGGTGVAGVAGAPGAIAMIAQGAQYQTADLQQWQNSDGLSLVRIDASGNLILASNGRLGLGTASPGFTVHAVNPAADGALTLECYSSVGPIPRVNTRTSRGTPASPSASQVGDRLFQLSGYGRGASGFSSVGSIALIGWCAENFTDTTQGAYLAFWTTPIGSPSTARAERLRIDSNGNIGIGTTSPNAAALVDIASATQGFLPPRMTTTQKNAISNPPEGLIIYDTTVHKLCVRGASAWETITSS